MIGYPQSQVGDSVMAIIFKGFSPHDLSAMESGTARSVDGKVEMTLYVLDEWRSPTSHAIRVPMQPSVARTLANHLTAAAVEAELEARD
jgi:hypothetical protein